MAALLMLGGCSKSHKTDTTIAEPVLQRIEVDPPAPNVPAGSSADLAATGVYTDGTTRDLTGDVAWSSNDGSVLTISADGTATGVAPGSSTITATLTDVQGATQLHVNNATLVSLELAPLTAQSGKSVPIAFSVFGRFSDDSLLDLTSQARWTSAPAGVSFLTKGNTTTASSATAGAYSITAGHAGKSVTAVYTVTDATLLGIEVSIPSPTIGVGANTQAKAIGYLSDGSAVDITATVSWTSSSNNVSLDTDSAHPIATGNAPGSANLIASLNGISGFTLVQVSAAALASIQIQSSTDQLLVGQSFALAAMGEYSDGTRREITPTVLWSSNNDSIYVSNAVTNKGRVTAMSSGTAIITAAHAGITATLSLRSVQEAPIRLDISPPAARLPVSSQQPFVATATYADGNSRDVTADALWESSQSQTLAIGNGNRGIATAIAVGTATITARFGDLQASVDASVTAASLENIELSPRTLVLAKGTRAAIIALGSYSDGSTLDLSGQVQWQMDGAAAVLGDLTGDGRTVVAQSAGTSTVFARLGSRVGSTVITVTTAIATQLAIQITAPTLASGTTERVQLTATFSDGTSQLLGDDVAWSSSNPAVAVTRTSAGQMTVQALAPGQTIITAKFGSLQQSTAVTVTPATLTGLAISGSVGQAVAGTVVSLRVTGTFSDTTQQDVTRDANWSSLTTSIAVMSNASGSKGEVTLLQGGTGKINAALAGITTVFEFAVSSDPTLPVSIATAASPNIILTTGSDATTIRAVVKASGNGARVPDGTAVSFVIEQGAGNLNKTTGTTVDGVAEARLTSTTAGLIVVRTTVVGTDISNKASVFAAADFSPALLRGGFFSGEVIDNVVQPGSRFGYLVINLSNRTFNALSLQFYHGSTPVSESVDPTLLSGGVLEGGTWMGVIISTDEPYQNETFIALYVLNEPFANKVFAPALAFKLPANVAKTN